MGSSYLFIRDMISVCMATYNGEKFLRQQIDSILSQLSMEDELVISDDGSTDGTLDIIRGYADSRIKLYCNTQVKGVNGNFENALRHSKGDYIFLSDQDDVWLEGKVKSCVEGLRNAYCVVHDCKVVDTDLNVVKESFFTERKSGGGFWKNLYKNSYLGCCMAFRREMLEYALPYPHPLPVFQEGWIASLSAIKGIVVFLPIKGILYRRHDSNASSTSGKSDFSLKKKITYRMQLLYKLLLRLMKIR